MKKIRVLFIPPLLLVASKVMAVPFISTATWSGGLDNGTAVTLTGTGFGTKRSTGSLVYDGVESGRFDSFWANTYDTTIITVSSQARHSNSSKTMYLNFIGGRADARLEGEGTSYEYWFCSWFAKFENNWDWGTSGFAGGDQWLSNVKMWRVWDVGSELDNYFWQYAGNEGTRSGRIKGDTENVIPNTSPGGITPSTSQTVFDDVRDNLALGAWHQFEVQWRDSSINTANGTIKAWVDGQSKIDNTLIETRDGSSVYKRIHTVGADDTWGVGSDAEGVQAPNEYLMDDVYCDNTWSAVFVSTSPTYAAGGTREYSLSTSWSATSITFTLFEGSFNTGTDTLYAYVRASDGTVNTNGLALTAGGGGGGGGDKISLSVSDLTVKGDIKISGNLLIK